MLQPTPFPTDKTKTAYEVALDTALKDLEAARAQAESSRKKLADAETLIATLEPLIERLINAVPAHKRAEYEGRLPVAEPDDASSSRGTPLFDNVVWILKRSPRPSWSTAELREELRNRGIDTDPKAISNVLGYLERQGRLTRVSRGCYRLADGSGMVTGLELEGGEYGQTRMTEHDV